MTRSLSRAPLSGQRVAVLGGSGRMGAAIAAEAIALGAEVVLLGRDAERLGEVAAQLGTGVDFRSVDAADPEALESALAALAPLDHLVVATSAGASAAGIADTAPDAARAAFERFWTSYAVLHLASAVVVEGGSVVLLSGSSARTPAPGAGVWTALHGSIEALARAATIDIAPVRVNVVSPGGIGMAPDRQLLPRPGVPTDIALAVASLLANPAVTGAVLDVDSGERKGRWSGG